MQSGLSTGDGLGMSGKGRSGGGTGGLAPLGSLVSFCCHNGGENSERLHLPLDSLEIIGALVHTENLVRLTFRI